MPAVPPGPPGLIVFDCDGVLVDSEILACRTVAACLTEAGFATDAATVMDRYVGISTVAMLADVEARAGRRLPEGFAAALARREIEVFAAELVAIDGVAAVLDGLATPVCVASSSTPERLRQSLGQVGLLARFQPHVFSASEVPCGKPAPDLFLHAAARMAVPPAAAVVVEDSVAGVTGAVAAGMRVIGFVGGGHCRPGHGERLRAAGAATVCDRMDGLARALRALGA